MNLADLLDMDVVPRLAPDGVLLLNAPKGALTPELIERIRESKPELIAEIHALNEEHALVKTWQVFAPGREPFGLICVQGTTREALLERYPRGTRVEPQR